MGNDQVGISGFAAYLPPYRVDLQDWCEWTGNDWDKIRNVVGTGFRMLGPAQSVYTLAATATLRLIDQYDIDPQRIRFLSLGTESSTDNSAGAVIVKGMLDEALRQRGQQPISRNCEVQEVKHACLGGVYAMKNALRFLALEPRDSVAIVVSADIAKYDLGSSGESTQGAGAVAMLLERSPRLLEVDLAACGSASDYRAVDFRKPMTRPANGNGSDSIKFHDTPVFNGKYSTSCYLDETLHALRDMESKLARNPADYYSALRAVFMHRPYQQMPINSWGFCYLVGLAHDGDAGNAELAEYCASANLQFSDVLAEMQSAPNILSLALEGDLNRDPYPMTMQLLKGFRKCDRFKSIVEEQLSLGSDMVREIGNVYSASLPAWIAAGLEEALHRNIDLAGQDILAIGYGSGDAAEAIPMRAVTPWKEATKRIQFAAAMEPVQNLDRSQYSSLHATGHADSLQCAQNEEFMVERIGCSSQPGFADDGIEYYRFIREDRVST